MTKKLTFLLSFVIVFSFMLHSCRNDYLSDHTEVYNDNSKFQLTSKTISLSESKHKAELIPKLEKAESEIKKIQKSYSGKSVQYGNGISIDTDQVIYIENGPNYHTYTFNINRENAGTDAPVENLLLSPLPDGSYREFLVTYYLTEQEKQNIREGNTISMQGKSEIVELAKGSFGNPLGKASCGYETVDVYIPCGTGEHHAGNVGSWSGCKWQKEGFAGPKHYSLVAYVCTGSPDDPGTSNPGTGSGGGGSGSSGGGGNNNPPCEVRPPLTPKPGLTDENGCPIGNPTQPNLPNPKDPCGKTKSLMSNTKIKPAIDALKTKAPQGGEEGYKIKADGTPSNVLPGGPHEVELGDAAGYQGGYHNHTPTGIKIFSPNDIVKLLSFAMAQPNGNIGDGYMGVIGSEVCSSCPGGYKYFHYIIRFSGTSQELANYLYNSNWNLDNLKTKYQRRENELSGISSYSNNNGATLNEKGLEKLLFDTLKNMGMEGKINLQRIENDGTIKNVILNNDGTTTATPC
ncbi:hypothetical protein ABXT08_03525 [Chryseobacterium sp. NRRL B-14859]|uniref:hypothetical protein n=1 Tax=Chryseobacterium sp. NRRL B-14859 TaxID=1562763 RepID=UPI003392A54B